MRRASSSSASCGASAPSTSVAGTSLPQRGSVPASAPVREISGSRLRSSAAARLRTLRARARSSQAALCSRNDRALAGAVPAGTLSATEPSARTRRFSRRTRFSVTATRLTPPPGNVTSSSYVRAARTTAQPPFKTIRNPRRQPIVFSTIVKRYANQPR